MDGTDLFDITPTHPTGTLDLFGHDPASVCGEIRRYASGVAAPAIWRGYAAARVPMCVVAADLAAAGVARAVAYRRDGGTLLVDSGAFVYRERPDRLDWARVIDRYLAIADGVGARASFILPDVVGCQAGSLTLAQRWGASLTSLAIGGHETLVPMQRGGLTVTDYYEAYVEAIGFDPTGLAVPSHTAAMPVRTVRAIGAAQFLPTRIHFLGISRRSRPLLERMMALRESDRRFDVSADACEHRAHVGQDRKITRWRRESLRKQMDDEWEVIDDTEDQAWGAAEQELRRMFPQASRETIADMLCSSWGVMAFNEQVNTRLEAECGPGATAISIERFARERFT